jgi:type IX secretion system PorP/SprF family membrane protein
MGLKTIKRFFNFSGLDKQRILAVSTLFLIVSVKSFAQEESNFTQFYINPALLNPAMTGVEGRTSASLAYRARWDGENTHSVRNMSIQIPFPNRISFGLAATNDYKEVIDKTSLQFSGSYTLPISVAQQFRFGFSSGFSNTPMPSQAALNIGSLVDPSITDQANQEFRLTGSLAMFYNGQTLHGGLVLANFFHSSTLSSSSAGLLQIKPLDRAIAHVSNRFYFSKSKYLFEPYLVYRLNSASKSQIELAGLFHFDNLFYAGASIRQNVGASILAGLKLKRRLAVGVSYSFPIENVLQSAEAHISFLLGKQNSKIPGYSFIDTKLEKRRYKTGIELAYKKTRVRGNINRSVNLDKIEDEYQRFDSVEVTEKSKKASKKSSPKKESERVVTARNENESVPLKREATEDFLIKSTTAKRLDSVFQSTQETDQLKQLTADSNDVTETTQGSDPAKEERHEFVKRGNSEFELSLGHHVIAGVFSSQTNAKKYRDGLRKSGFAEAGFGFLTARNQWYVNVSTSQEVNTAKAERDRLRNIKIFKDSWLLTVHP